MRPSRSEPVSSNGVDPAEEQRVAEIIERLRSSHAEGSQPASISARLSTARAIIAVLDSSNFMEWPDRYDDQVFVISELQNLAYHEADGGGDAEIAQWCIRQYLHLLAQSQEERVEVLTGLGHAWLLRAQGTLARIGRNDSSSSGASSTRPSSSTGPVSFTSSDDARETARATAEADALAGTPDYVEARGMLLPATEYFQRAIVAAERLNRLDGSLLSFAAEAHISLGSVSPSHHNEQYFNQAINYLQTASRIAGFQLSPFLQHYLDDFGRLMPVLIVLEARLEQSATLKKVVDAIKDLVQDCNFDCNDSGIALQAMDNSHVALVSMMLKAEMFSPFRCDRNIALGINLTSLTKVLRAAQNEDILTLKAEDAPDVVNLVFESVETDRLSEYDIKLMDIDQEHLGIPDTEYAATIEMPSAEFQRIVRDLITMSESVSIEATKDGVRFACQGDIGSGSVTVRQHTNVDKPEHDVNIQLSEPVSLTFGLKYLVNFSKATALAPKVKLSLSQEVPLLVEYNLSGTSYLRFYLAPKVTYGYVGNTMATFVMQVLGCNHTGYRRFQGRRTTPEEITALYAGLQAAYLTDFDVLLSGYIPSAAAVDAVAAIGRDLRGRHRHQATQQQNKNGDSSSFFFWVLDPVMGDQGRLYVAEDVVGRYIECVRSSGGVDLLLPNGFEAELLTGRPAGSVRTLADVVSVVGDLHALGVPHVIITTGSSRKSDGSSRVWKVEVPVLDCFFSGTGDMFAALMVGRLREAAQAQGLLHTPSWMPPDEVAANETPLAKAAEKVLSSMQTVLEKTITARDQELARLGPGQEDVSSVSDGPDDVATRKYLALTKASEIRLVRNWTDLVAPTVRFTAEPVHQLRNPIPNTHLEIRLAQVEQQHLDLAAVVRINHPGPSVDAVLGRQPAARRHSPVCAGRARDRDVCADQGFAPRWDHRCLRCV
ncbi:hypothetical protein DV738_g4555, partial [Chaetothyriales sp. CBS 135597]